jgi:hypothetical protein
MVCVLLGTTISVRHSLDDLGSRRRGPDCERAAAEGQRTCPASSGPVCGLGINAAHAAFRAGRTTMPQSHARGRPACVRSYPVQFGGRSAVLAMVTTANRDYAGPRCRGR